MLHVAIDDSNNRGCGSKRAFDDGATFQGDLNGDYQLVDVFDLIEGRYYDSEFQGICERCRVTR